MKFIQLLSAACAATVATAFSPTLQNTARSTSSTLLFADADAGDDAAAPLAEIQFVRGVTEQCVPDVRLTRARDGSSGVATFAFDSPNVFDASTAAKGEITGMFMIDQEGEISTTAVNATTTASTVARTATPHSGHDARTLSPLRL